MTFAERIEVWRESLDGFDINDLNDFDNIGKVPMPVKIILWSVTFVACMYAGYHFDIADMQNKQNIAVEKEAELKRQYENKAFQAANLDAYREQMVEMEDSFGALVSQLPSDTEVPGLLEDITNKGVESGLEFQSIDLNPEAVKEFYVELPISISAIGTYHDMGAFVSGVAGLPRIVTLHDFEIKPEGDALLMTITAKTYRYKKVAEDGSKSKSRRKK